MFKRKYGRARSLNAFAQRVRGKAQARRNASETQRDGTRLRAECDAAEAELGVSLRDLEHAEGESDLAGFKAEAALRTAEKSTAAAAALLDKTRYSNPN